MSGLDEILARIQGLPEEERSELEQLAVEATKDRLWVPNPGPQADAYFCEADELFYGGQAGGGKSALACGLAVTEHQRSLILRRINKDAKKLAEAELLGKIFDGDRSGWNGTDLKWKVGGQSIEFGGCEMEVDKQRYKGDPHDLIVFDEVTDFLKSQYEFITIWNRSTTPGQRCRVVATGNPPTTAEGLWVIEHWAAWLDPKHPNPAKPGELRYYARNEEGNEIEVDGPGPHLIGGKDVYAKSRTFIPAKLSDNPDLAADGEYERVLDALPKELRDAYRDGRFDAGIKDNPWQLIPTEWVVAAQNRWTPEPPQGIPMCTIGVDVAQGGDDNNILSPRHDSWFAEQIEIPGKKTPLGTDVSGVVIANRRDNATVVVDCGGGYGGTVYTHLKDNGIPVVAYKGAEESRRRSKDKQLKFNNRRTEVWWRFREALDPAQPGGSSIALPPSNKLLADLTAPTFEVTRQGGESAIKIEPKDKLIKRLGRSTDHGDSVTMAWSSGDKMASSHDQWKSNIGGQTGRKPRVVMGHQSARRR
ncbi:terminase [Marinobacter nanhaiticus D15-8W]|uniref:Terminase n=1 Tax=Marinobacter nanhaiticus D15-8W TaxID=626887 RepID=N6X731_9GAMM|nr:terminase family protein [Marinobacter nanhaiticus]ENO16948.1 terminase [Marinobacter nanhaiticus D15-8W]BES72171.1 terminase [Marinobacter nanhaiticus D15-8W]